MIINLRKGFAIVLGIMLFIWFVNEIKDLYFLMKKYPKAFEQKEGISLIRFYNTYETLSVGQYKIDSNNPASRNCSPLSLDFPRDEYLSKLISNASYEYRKQLNLKASYRKETSFTYIGANCTSESKLISLKYKGNEAHATFACEMGNLVQEFTYSSTDSKCAVMEYKKEWGIKPIERTLGYTTSLLIF